MTPLYHQIDYPRRPEPGCSSSLDVQQSTSSGFINWQPGYSQDEERTLIDSDDDDVDDITLLSCYMENSQSENV